MNIASHFTAFTAKKLFALTLVAVVLLLATFAGVASAEPGYSQLCSDCHRGAGAAPIVTITSAQGADPVTYSVHQTSTAWAAYDLSDNVNRIAGSGTSDDTFTAPAGHYVRVCSSEGSATGTFTQAYLVTPTPPRNGSITPTVPQVVAPGGSSQAFTITPSAGYHITDVKINGVSDAAAIATGSYTATNVQADTTIVATFALDGFTVTPTAGPNGTISPATVQTVAPGGSITFTVTAKTGYHVAKVLVDGVAATLTSGKYTFTNVIANHSIAVTFAAPIKTAVTLKLTGLRSGVLRLHKIVTAKGVLTPAHAATAKITIQRKVSGTWRTVTTKSRTTSASGAYSTTYKPTKKGAYRMQTSVAKTTKYAASKSPYRTFTVK